MKKVLVAEDVEIISTMITRVLEKLGIEVLVAADGEQCLAMARAQMPDLIILDLNAYDDRAWFQHYSKQTDDKYFA